MAEEKKEDFTQHSEYKNINKVVSIMFNEELFSRPDERKILFSKQIQDWKTQKNTAQEPSDHDLKQLIIEDLRQRYEEAIQEIQQQYQGAELQEGDKDWSSVNITYRLDNKRIKFGPFFGVYNNGYEIQVKPKSLRFYEKDNDIFVSKIRKFSFSFDKHYEIEDTFPPRVFDEKDKEKLIKSPNLHNVKIEFEEGKICLQSYFNTTSDRVTVNEIEFTLNKGKITEIKQSYDNGTKQNPPTTITDENKINDKIKEIFGDKNNTAIQNIINELDDKQITLITNGHPGLLNDEDKKNVPPKEEKLKEEELEESNQKEQENINLRTIKIKKKQYDAGTKNDINGQDMKFEKKEKSPMCNCKCWNNLKSWCSKFCSSETTMD